MSLEGWIRQKLSTPIGSCKLNGVEPEAYLRHVLATIADHPIYKIKELVPWNLNIPAE